MATTTVDDNREFRRANGVVAIFVCPLIAFIALVVLAPAPLMISASLRSNVMSFMPEGFAFFTRDPQEPDLAAYERQGNRWIDTSPPVLAEPSNWLGLSRSSRAHGIEIGLLMQSLPSNAWVSCADVPISCFGRLPPETVVVNESARPSICGEVGLVRQPPIPYAFARTGRQSIMPSLVAHLQVTCPGTHR